MRRPALLLLPALLLTACALGPGAEPRHTSAQEALPAALPAAQIGKPPQAATPGLPWAQAFQGARLPALIQLALQNNRDLRIAALNVESARAVAAARGADLWPTVNAGLTGSRQPTASGGISSLYTAGLQVSGYELDVFGRLRGLDAAAAAQVLASSSAQQAVRTSLIASVVNAEIALQSDAALRRISQDTLTGREASLRLTRQRFERGVASELDLRAAESLLEAARVALAQVRRQQALDENALVLLVGSALPTDLPPPLGRLEDLAPLTELPAGIDSSVLQRRPDLRQLEAQLQAADANIDAARAAFYPRITLTGSVGRASGDLSDLFKHSAWSFAPQLVMPLFDAGRNRANLAQVRAARETALAQYEKGIQTAFREVADALAARGLLAEQREAQLAQLSAERRRTTLAQARFDAGITNSLDLLDAQRSTFAAEQALVQTQSVQAQNLVGLWRALGGDGGDAGAPPSRP
ncbi:efflux transporter outer membrane subunit [Roseateles paludis]|uniref:Efflux transporter outer membrane subunit n=1 Tax=Roseateles paludis TaxID=3145238 RepID=A0ABV0FZ31_9BURK